MSPTEPPISIYGTLPRKNFRRLSAAPLPDSGEYTHYATLRRDQLTSSRISLRQLGVMVEAEERRRMEEGEGSSEGEGSIASNSPELDGKEDRKKKKGRGEGGRVALGRLLPGAMVYSYLPIAPLIQTLIVNKTVLQQNVA
jgi:hypothetical protein